MQIFLEETNDDHVLTDQTLVKMEPTLSYDNEPCTLDWTSSADDIAEVRQLYMFLFFFFQFIYFTYYYTNIETT